MNIAVAALLVVSISPVLIVAIPAMADYPNHLARMYVLAAAGTPDANPFYEVTWRPYPNLAMDAIVPLVARLTGVELATKLFLLASQILIVSGAMALEFAVKRRHQISGLCALLVLYSLPFSWGFLNFQFTLGLVLWALAAATWLRSAPVPARMAVHALCVAVLYLGHIVALGLYAVALGLIELSSLERDNVGRIARDLVLIGLPVIAAIVLSRALGGEIGSGPTEWEFASKLRSLFRFVNGYSPVFSAVSAAALILTGYALFRSGSVAMSRNGLWLAAGFVALFLAMPWRVSGSAYVDVRVVVAALLIVPAFVVIKLRTRATLVAAVLVVTIIVANAIFVGVIWRSYEADYARLKDSFVFIQEPSRVLVARSVDSEEDPIELPIHHAPTLAVSAKALVPLLYTVPGMQPIRVVESSRHLGIAEIVYYSPVPMRLLAAVDATDTRVPRFIRNWQREFDYLYVVGPRVVNPLPDQLEQLTGGDRFSMYRIRRRER